MGSFGQLWASIFHFLILRINLHILHNLYANTLYFQIQSNIYIFLQILEKYTNTGNQKEKRNYPKIAML